MKRRQWGILLSLVAALAACKGGGSAPPSTGPIGSIPPPPPPPSSSACSLRARQDWAAAQLREWYLFPETLPASLDPSPYGSLEAYVDALTATARAQGRDRFFTYVTTITQDNAFFSSGSSAGFGVRLSTDTSARRLFVVEAYEGAPGLAAGLDRGTEILAIGTSANDLRTVDSIIAAEGANGVTNALGPSTPGTTRVLRISDAAGTRNVSVSKANYSIPPVSSRYGARIIDDGGRRVGYVNLRTFIASAEQPLREAFGAFRAQGITEIIVDFRYNGGGLTAIADLMGDLLGRNRSAADILAYTTYRPEKSANNSTRTFRPQAEAVAPTRIAFIGTGGTASASEQVINTFIPYLHADAALVGTNTYGKPVGQVPLDLAACDDRLRVIAFASQNAARQGDYYSGLATKVEASCQAGDDLGHPMGDPQEASTKAALDFLAGRSCARISAGGITPQGVREPLETRALLMPERPTTVQREAPGTF